MKSGKYTSEFILALFFIVVCGAAMFLGMADSVVVTSMAGVVAAYGGGRSFLKGAKRAE